MHSFWTKLKAFCCCKSVEEDDTEHLLNEERNIPDFMRTSNGVGTSSNTTFSNPTHFGSGMGVERLNPKAPSPNDSHSRTQSEAEEDALNKILDKTQAGIIDVTNMEYMGGVDPDVVQRTRTYAKFINDNEKLETGVMALFNSNKSTNVTESSNYVPTSSSSMPTSSAKSVLNTIGNSRLTESLNENILSKISKAETATVDNLVEAVAESLANESKIEVQEPMIGYMNDDSDN